MPTAQSVTAPPPAPATAVGPAPLAAISKRDEIYKFAPQPAVLIGVKVEDVPPPVRARAWFKTLTRLGPGARVARDGEVSCL